MTTLGRLLHLQAVQVVDGVAAMADNNFHFFADSFGCGLLHLAILAGLPARLARGT